MPAPTSQPERRIEGPDLREFHATTGFVGCPHCGGPVDVRADNARAAVDLAHAVLGAMERGVSAKALAAALSMFIADAHDTIAHASSSTARLHFDEPYLQR